MDKVAQGVGLGVVASVPGIGGVLSGLLGGLIEGLNEHKQRGNQCDSLREQLPERLEELKKLNTDDYVYQPFIEDIRGKVEKFNQFVQGLEKTRKRDFFKRGLKRRQKEFESRLASFNKDVKSGNKKLEHLSDVIQKLVLTLDKWLADPDYVQNLLKGSDSSDSSDMDDRKDALKGMRSGSTKQKQDAQRQLVLIALKFLRCGNEKAVATGLKILDTLFGDASARRVVMMYPSVVRTLLDREVERPGGKVVRWMLKHLVGELDSFFQQLAPLSKLKDYHPAIAGAGLVPWSVRDAKPTVKAEEGQETIKQIKNKDALCVLVEIAKSEECKPAIAEAGGIAALVADYQLLEMTEYAFDPIIVDVVGALAGLAEHAACREHFAAAHGEWTLLDFLWKCSTIRTMREVIGEDGDVLSQYDSKYNASFDIVEPTSFNRDIVQRAETKTGRAQWTLATLNDDWKRRVLYLGALCPKSKDGDPSLHNNLDALGDVENHCSQLDAMRGWLRLANWIKTNDQTQWCVRIIWSLLMDEDTSFIVAEWLFGGDLGNHWRSECAIFVIENTYDDHTYINWSALEEMRYVNNYNMDAHPSGTESPNVDISPGATSTGQQNCGERAREEERKAILKALDPVEQKMIDSICNHLALPQNTIKRLSTCLRKVLRALEEDKTAKRAKALGVLWLCERFMAVDPTFVGSIVKVCKKVITGRLVDEVFWAVCLLLSMLS